MQISITQRFRQSEKSFHRGLEKKQEKKRKKKIIDLESLDESQARSVRER